MFFSWTRKLFQRLSEKVQHGGRSASRPRRRGLGLVLESLEDRTVPAFLAPSPVTPSFFPEVAGDFNGDGRSDLVSIIGSPASNQVQVWLSNGDGAFQAPLTLTAAAGTAVNAFVADVNGDGHQDLLVGIGGTALGMSTFLGNGDGTFQAPIDTRFNGFGAAATGDFNGDGKLDLLGLDTATGALRVAFGDGTGAFNTLGSTSFGVAMTGFSSAVGDFNGDGRLDFAEANGPIYNPGGTVSYSATVSFGNGDGTFQFPTSTGILFTSTLLFDPNISSAPNPLLAAGDFNGDGRTDLAVAISQDHTIFEFAPGTAHVVGHSFPVNEPEPGYLKVLFQGPTGVLQIPITFDAGIGPYKMQAADLNGDGRSELIINGDRGVIIAQTGADGTFSSALGYETPPNVTESVGDFNGDGKLDLALQNSHQILLGNGDGTFRDTFFTALGNGASKSVSVDLNGDGVLDLVALNRGDGTVSVLLGRGHGAFLAQKMFPVGSGPEDLAVGDFNGDGKLDLAVARSGGVSILAGNGDGTFGAPSALALPADVFGSIAAADFNADGVLDLLVSDWNLQTVEVLNGSNFQVMARYPTAGRGPTMVVGDFNGDGRPDFATASVNGITGDSSVTAFINNGSFSFTAASTFLAGFGITRSMAVADLNGDGKLDLALTTADPTGTQTGPVNVFLGNGDGTFGAVIAATSPLPIFTGAVNHPETSLVIGDLNGDGIPDLAINGNGVNISLGRGDGNFYPSQGYTTVDVLDEPGALTLADFNGDGRLDVAQIDVTAGDPNYTLRSEEYVALNLGDVPSTFGAVGFRVSAPSTVTENVPFSISVTAVDASGNPVPGFLGTVSIWNDHGLATPYTFTAADAGTHVFTNAFTELMGGTHTLSAGAPFLTTGSAALTAGPGNFLVTIPATTTAGVGVPITISAVDALGNPFPAFTGPITFTSSDPRVQPYTVFMNAAEAGTLIIPSTQFGINVFPLFTAGPQTISASAQYMGPVSTPIVVTPAAAASLAISGLPTSTAAGVQTFTLTARDRYGNVASGYTGTVTVSSSDIQANLPAAYTFTAGDAGIHTFTVTLKTAGTQTLSIHDTANSALTASATVLVTPSAASTFRFASASSDVAGLFIGIGVSARDMYGNLVSSYNGTVHFTSSDPLAVLPVDTTLSNGTATVTVRLMTPGTQSLTATDSASAAVAGTETILVTPAILAGIDVVGFPATTAGVTQNFTLIARDTTGQFMTGYTGTVVFSSSDSQAVLPASYTFTATDFGVHTFAASLRTAGVQSITVADTSATVLGSEGGILITPAAAATLGIVGFPSVTTAGVAHSFTVTAYDAFGNVATGYTGRVGFGSSDLQSSLPLGGYSFTATDAGIHTFSGALKTAGTQWLGVSDVITGGALTATEFGIVVNAAAAATLTVTGPRSATVGVAQTFTVTSRDVFGNVAPGYTGTVTFSSSDSQAGVPGNYTFTAADAGSHTFAVTLKTAGTQSVTVQDTVNAAFTVTLAGIAVSPAVAATFTVTGFPATTAGVAQTFTVAARDAFGNLVTGYTGTVRFSSSDVQAGLPASYTFTAADAGVHTFTATLKTAGSQSITVQDTANAALLGSQTSIAVTAAAATQFLLIAPTSVTQGTGFSITVKVLDAYGNVVTGYRGKVHFSTTATNAGLPSDYTFSSSSDNGVHVFSVTLNTLGFQTIKVTDTANSSILGSAVVNVVAKTSGGGGTSGGGTGGGGSGGGGGTA